MAFTMHSHSGQFCPGHAKDQLEDIVQRAIELKMFHISFTEHMPRDEPQDRYPEEIEAGSTCETLFENHTTYIQEARRLQQKYGTQIQILIGFETEWIRPANAALIRSLASDPTVDYFVGSVHHVHEIPIDFDKATYVKARDVAGGTDERIFEDYFDSQHEMLETMKPAVVGHFDLIRLMADEPDMDLRCWNGVWERVRRNLGKVVEIGALLEINSSALRKGLKEPYPMKSVCLAFKELGGKFTLSDDSHGVAQVGLNFGRVKKYLLDLDITVLYYLEKGPGGSIDDSRHDLAVKAVQVAELAVDEHPST